MSLPYDPKNLLKIMYDNCVSALNKKTNSLILSAIESNKNTIRTALQASKIKMKNDSNIDDLVKEGFIRCIEPGTYALTAKGAWYVEDVFYNHKVDMIVEYLDTKQFMLDSKKINEKNKMILFAILSARCFSENTCAELHTERSKEVFIQLLKNSSDFLAEYNLIKPGCFESSNKVTASKNEVGNLTNNVDDLPSCTYDLFKSIGDKEYYVNVSKDGEIDKNKVRSLFEIVFEGKINFEDVYKVVEFCNNQCLHLGYVYHSKGDESFSGSEIDYIIEECILSAVGL